MINISSYRAASCIDPTYANFVELWLPWGRDAFIPGNAEHVTRPACAPTMHMRRSEDGAPLALLVGCGTC